MLRWPALSLVGWFLTQPWLILLYICAFPWLPLAIACLETCSYVIPMKGLFTTYKAGDFGTVKMGNSSYSKIVGIGDVYIETNVGSTMMLKDVRHVQDLRMNVFSTLAIDQAGYCNYLANGRWKLTKG